MAISATNQNGMTQQPNPQRARQRYVIACVVAQAVCSLGYVEAALAQEPDRVTIDARRCLELASPDERLACFETQVGDARNRGSTAPAPPRAPTPSSRQSIPAEEPAEDIAKLPQQGAPADARDQSEWVGYITALQERAPSQYLITLDSGQVWQQQLAERYPLRVGQRVRIHKGRFGQRLQAEGINGFIRVERIH